MLLCEYVPLLFVYDLAFLCVFFFVFVSVPFNHFRKPWHRVSLKSNSWVMRFEHSYSYPQSPSSGLTEARANACQLEKNYAKNPNVLMRKEVFVNTVNANALFRAAATTINIAMCYWCCVLCTRQCSCEYT